MGASITGAGSVDAILKEFYLGPIINQLNNEILAVELFQKAQVDWQGKKAVIPVKVTRNSGVAFLAESATLPTAGNQGYADLLVTARFVYGRFSVTGPLIEAAKTSAGAFVTAIDGEMSGLVEDVKNASNKGMFDGSEVIGYVWQKQNAAVFQYAGATSTAVSSAFTLGGANSTARLVRLDTYAFVGAATQVNAVTETSITFNAAIDTTAVPAGVVLAVTLPSTSVVKYNSAGAWNNEPAGIMTNLSSQFHFGVDRTTATGTATQLQAIHRVVDPAVDVYATLNLRAMQKMLDDINLASGKKPDLILCNDTMKVEYTALLQGTGAQNLFVPTDKNSDGYAGFERVFYNGIEIKSSRHCPKGVFFFLSSKVSWKLCVLGEGGFMDQDGSILFRVVNTDAYEGTYRWYYNLVATEPHANGALCAISF